MSDNMDVDLTEEVAMIKNKGKAPATEAASILDSSPWVEKYRPKSLSDVTAHKDIIDTISRLTAENRLPHLLLYGPPGTGKTSTILAVARQLYGSSGYQNMTLELNASDDRGLDFVRKQIQDFASTKRIFSSGFKLVILDESDAMTKDAQFALRRVIEKYTRNTRFCMICNYVSKIIPALQSRCTRFRFAPLAASDVKMRLTQVLQLEGVPATDGGVDAVVKLGCGDMRKTLNILQSTCMASAGGRSLDEEAVYLTTGAPRPGDIQQVLQSLLNLPFHEAYQQIMSMQEKKGLALIDITRELTPWVFRMNIPTAVRIEVVDALSDLEHRLNFGTSEKLQLGSLVAAFTHARVEIVKAAA
eukprot:CAMPEP_0196588198 /NCGR_PEP_ID=MMETSP1081-20130531/59798_1 /TAXON_ID=36882 /ORGANISM="Pyramimonas amylifera, Strain CCMP720" /LENGTH=358 /DNA_ID=CAMNT_0041910623 /DNA_START=44 /DNA_END=1120 /DNA_ORIENTATION=-